MTEIHPIQLRDDLEKKLRLYIKATLPISPNYPKLSTEVDRILSGRNLLVKGPYVEATADFKKGRSLSALCSEGALSTEFAQIGEPEFSRKLHSHQEEAVSAIVQNKENVVVATGTGSGKTECFLYPILNSLLLESEEERKVPAVRAMLIYPLNALANDQLYKRIVPLFVKKYQDKGFRVGRFTGLTPKKSTRKQVADDLLAADPSLVKLFGNTIPEGFQLTREEMLECPPDLLITNYAMLEHLLLFPKNSALFERCNLKYIVLDEVHSYSGAQASEVALLLRKLRNRLGVGNKALRCIATSASLGGERRSGR